MIVLLVFDNEKKIISNVRHKIKIVVESVEYDQDL